MTTPDPSTPTRPDERSGYLEPDDPSTPVPQNFENHVKQLTFLCDKIDERDVEVARLRQELESAREHQQIAVDRYHEIQELKRRNQVLKEAVKLAGDCVALFLSTIVESKSDQIAEENAIKFAYDQGRKALEKLNDIYQ